MTRPIDPDNRMGDAYWLDFTAEILRRCDGMVLLPGYERSEGTRNEILIAESAGLFIKHLADLIELPDCLRTEAS